MEGFDSAGIEFRDSVVILEEATLSVKLLNPSQRSSRFRNLFPSCHGSIGWCRCWILWCCSYFGRSHSRCECFQNDQNLVMQVPDFELFPSCHGSIGLCWNAWFCSYVGRSYSKCECSQNLVRFQILKFIPKLPWQHWIVGDSAGVDNRDSVVTLKMS